MSKIGDEGVVAETTNGTISLAVPSSANARLFARVVNGAIRPEGLNLAISESTRRRLDATLGTGGPSIKLDTTNGAITIKAK